jgi:hypothetical protein
LHWGRGFARGVTRVIAGSLDNVQNVNGFTRGELSLSV